MFREVEGLPKGSIKAVIDAFAELVDEGCLAVFGPAITDNAVPTREAIVHCGFGFGLVQVNPALRELGWDPPRFMGTAFENAWINPVMWQAIVGWIGLDQYDEGNPVGQAFLDRFEAETGRRPQYCAPVVNRDLATVFLHAFADAHPLTPRGVQEALERVKMVPAASGAPGTAPLVRQVDPPGLDGRGLPGRRASSTPTA